MQYMYIHNYLSMTVIRILLGLNGTRSHQCSRINDQNNNKLSINTGMAQTLSVSVSVSFPLYAHLFNACTTAER